MLFKKTAIQLLALFASVRGYNLLVVIIAQYLSARYIFAPNKPWVQILLDPNLMKIFLATSFAIAGGYLINNFYDAEKDQINRPVKYLIEHRVPPVFQLCFYGLMNFSSLILASLVSVKTIFFFVTYIFFLWLYSHYLKKRFWASNFFAVLLAVTPFIAIMFYFKNYESIVFHHAGFLFLVLLIRDLIKDLENFKGDWVRDYKTIAVVYGEKRTKQIISFLVILMLIPVSLLMKNKQLINSMSYYFLATIPFLLLIVIILWKSPTQKTYLWLHNLLKVLIVSGILSILLIRLPL